MKKRIFALIMAMCLALSLLPASVFAENESDSDVVYGKYGTGTTWTQDNGTGTIEYKTGDGNTITLSKKATPLGDNTYRIDLEVKSTQTTTTTPPGAAATVLVLDTSGSMAYCAECGQENYHASGCEHYQEPDWDNWFPDNSVKTEETRLAAAKTAATNFLDSYKGDTAGVGRYVSLVSFAGSASVKCDWQDVSTTAGYNAVVQAIRNLSANGGTNLDAGLKNAANQFTKSAVSGISKDSKNVIALTDGIPTYYGKNTSQHGSYGCPDTNEATAKSAAALKESASLYTVCFGAANDRCWTAGSVHEQRGWNTVNHDTDGPLVGDFLRDSIATSATADTTYAYNAADSSELNKAFKAITTSITTGISSGTVTDPMGPNISVTAKPDNFASVDGETYTWELANGVKSTDGSKTTYTYQLSYTVTLDTTGEGFDENAYYPANGKTTFTSGDKTFEFPVPGVKGTIPSYQVKYAYTGTVPAGAPALPADETHKLHTDVTVAAEPALDGYVFSGWTTDDASVSGGQFKMPGKDVTLTGSWTLRSDLSYTVNYYWNGTTDRVAPSKTVDGQTFNAAVTESPIGVTGYTPVSADSKSLTIGTGTNEINFYYYQNVTLTANSGTVTYDGKEHSVSGFTVAPDGADFSAVTVGAKGTNVGTYDAKFAKDTVGTVDDTAKYIVTEANDGKLTITPVGGIVVTITGNTDSRPYSGAEQSVTDYTVSTNNPLYTEADFTFTGTATAKGTDADSYAMGLTPEQFENTNPNFENVTFIVTDGKLTITPRSVKLTSATDEKVYDGTPLTRPDVTVTGDGFVAGEVSDIRATGTVTNVSDGEQSNTIVYTTSAGFKPGNYSIEKDEGTLKITPVTDKVTVTVTGSNDSVGYDGNEHSVTGYTTAIDNQLYTVSDFTFTGEAIAKGTDADSYAMGLNKSQFANSSANFANVEFVVNDGALTVTPRPVTITADSGSKVYDGTALTKNSYTSTDPAAGDTLASVTVTGSQTNVGSSDNVASDATLMRGDRDVTANYAITYEKGTLAVTPLTDKVTVTITGNTGTVTYNGAEQSVTGYKVESISNPLYTAADFAFSGTASVTGTDAGTYMMGLTAAQFRNQSANITNVEFVVTDGSLQINSRSVKLTSATDEKVYDGQPLTNGAVTVSGDGFAEGEGAAYNVTGSQTNVGSSDNTFTYTLNPDTKAKNYTVETEPGKLSVTPVTAEVTVTITGNKSTVTYNGAEQSVTGYKVESISNPLYTEKNLAFSGEAIAKGTDSDTYKMNLTAAQFENNSENFTNVRIIVTDGELTINPMALTITAGSDSKAYDGTPLTCGEFDSTTPAEGDTVASVTLTGSQTNVGSGDNVASDAKLMRGDRDVTANYAIEYVDGKLTVTKNESAKLTADAYRGVYDGAAHDAVVKTTITGAVEGDSWTYAYSLDGENYTAELPQVKNVGTYPVWVKATNDNYVDLVTVVTAEVTPATVLVTADSHEWIIAVKDTCVSDPEPALTYQAESPVAGETPAFSGELSREPGAERGKTYQILQGDLALADGENFLASNYVLQFVPGELTVKARDITITKTVDVTKAFVGDKLTYTITVTNTGDVDLQDVAVVDEMLGIEQVIGELKAGESWTQQFTYTAQERDAGKTLVNTAVTGTKDEKTFDQVDSDGTEITQKPVPTGDQSMVGLWTATLLISAAGAAIILARKSRRSK